MTSPFTALSTADDVLAGHDLSGRRAIVTGGGSGIGLETARSLARAGASVTLAVRDTRAGDHAAEDIRRSVPGADIHVAHVDLGDISTIDSFARSWEGPLDILVNNAGIMNAPLSRNAEGWESHFAINYLGHFALTQGLHRALAASGSARVVMLSSSGHGSADIDFTDPFFLHRPYNSGTAYGQSKTADVLFAVEAGLRWKKDGIIVKAVMPGGVWTNLQRHWDPKQLAATRASYPGKTPQQGASTSIFAAVDPSVTADGPVYFEDNHPSDIVDEIADGLHGVRSYALDPVRASRLWDFSETLLADARQSAHSR